MAIELVCWLNYKDLLLATNGRRFGIVDPNNRVICPIKYLKIGIFVCGLATVKYKKNIFSKVQIGVVNEKGEETLFPSECEEVKVLSYNLLAVKVRINENKYKWMLTTRTGKALCSPKYDEAPEWVVSDKLLRASVDHLITLIDEKGHQLCKPQYYRIRLAPKIDRENGVACEGARNGYWYRINIKGVELKARYHEYVR